jgi:hypothetical protein
MKRFASCIVIVFGMLLSSCSMHAMTGDLISEFTWMHVNPYLLSTNDTAMACETAVSTGGMLLAYSRVTDMPHKGAVGTYLTAAGCAEAEAWEAELETIRALRGGDAEAAQDARIVQKRAHGLAAQRLYAAWTHMKALYGDPAVACPVLEGPSDELAWFMGNLAGASSVEHDRAAAAQVNVPLDVPRHAALGIACLDDATWFGIPSALQASVWLSIPGATPEGRDPWATLDEAMKLGEASGVRMAHLLKIKAAMGAGKIDVARATIKVMVAAQEAQEPPSEWRLLDLSAREQVQALSDRLWTEATGHRTPHRGLGQFWDDESDMVADEGLLDDIDEEETPE